MSIIFKNNTDAAKLLTHNEPNVLLYLSLLLAVTVRYTISGCYIPLLDSTGLTVFLLPCIQTHNYLINVGGTSNSRQLVRGYCY
jgi:hypothetical protein